MTTIMIASCLAMLVLGCAATPSEGASKWGGAPKRTRKRFRPSARSIA